MIPFFTQRNVILLVIFLIELAVVAGVTAYGVMR